MVEEDLGEASIVYEDPEGETVEETVQNEHIAYFQDHWILKTGEDDQGRDTIVRIPMTRVYRVERSVEAFEDEVATLTDQVQSMADELTGLLPFDVGGRRRSHRSVEDGPTEIDVNDSSSSDE